MKKNRIILLVVITFALILSSCQNNADKKTDTTKTDTSSIISTLTTTEAKYNFYKGAYEKTVALEQIDFSQDIATKQVTELMTVDSLVENNTVYKKAENGFIASGNIQTTAMSAVKNQKFYYTDNATYIDDGSKTYKSDGDILNISTWNSKAISKLELEGINEISCIQVQNGIKVTIISDTESFKNGNYTGYLSDYVESSSYIKSYRTTMVVSNDGYIIEMDDLLNIEETHTVVGIDDFTINKTITTNMIIKSPAEDVTVTPLDNYQNFETALIVSMNKLI